MLLQLIFEASLILSCVCDMNRIKQLALKFILKYSEIEIYPSLRTSNGENIHVYN